MSSRLVLKRSLEGSSIKALPKIVKAPTRFQKAIWTLALLIGLSAVSYQVSNLMFRYFQYSTTINILTVDGTPPFPDVTICHMDRNWTFHSLEMDLVGNHSYQSYVERIKGLQDEYTFNSTEWNIFDDITNFAGFIQNDDLIHQRLEYLRNLLIIDCVAYPSWQPKKCIDIEGSILQTILYVDPIFGFCATFSFNSTDVVRSLKLLVYLNNTDKHIQQPFDLSDDFNLYTSLTGVRLIIHPARTFPDIWLKSELVHAGQDASFTIDGTYLSHLKEPYGQCIEDTPYTTQMKLNGVFNPRGTHGYECYRMCARDLIYQECGCINIYYAVEEEDRLNGRMCGLVNEANISQTFTNMKCALVTEQYLDDFEEKCRCRIPCEHYSYDYEAKSLTWPHETYQLSFYEQYIVGHPYAQMFSAYDDIYELSKTEPWKALDLLKKETLIRENFAQIRILNHQRSYPHYTETPLVSIESLFGNMGGLLNLWVGITFITIIEIIDMVHQMYCGKPIKQVRQVTHNGLKQKTSSNGTNSEYLLTPVSK